MGLLSTSPNVSEEKFLWAGEEFDRFLSRTGHALGECTDEMAELMMMFATMAFSLTSDKPELKKMAKHLKVSRQTIRQVAMKILNTATRIFTESGEVWEKIGESMDMTFLVSDPEISELLKDAMDAIYSVKNTDDAQCRRFVQLDVYLCLLEGWPENRQELAALRERYPVVYKNLKDFVQRLEKESEKDRLRDMMLKDYERLEQYYEGTYFKVYPERRTSREKQFWDSEQAGTFRRIGAKVGRNDPCPCGSGKKYKNCCGRNK